MYTRDLTYYLYTAAEAFLQLPAGEKEALTDALSWTKRCTVLFPQQESFVTLQEKLSIKRSQD